MVPLPLFKSPFQTLVAVLSMPAMMLILPVIVVRKRKIAVLVPHSNSNQPKNISAVRYKSLSRVFGACVATSSETLVIFWP